MSILFEGVLQKKGKYNTAWKTRYCTLEKFINGDIFLYYYNSKMGNKLLGKIPLSQVYAIEVISDYDLKIEELPQGIAINTTTKSDKKYSFLVDTHDRKYVFAAFDPKFFIQWIRNLHQHIYGGIIKHGWLWKKGDKNKGWKQRYFILNKYNIKYYQDFEQTKYVGNVDLNDIICVNQQKLHNDHQKYKYIFELVTNKRIWILNAENNKERDRWTEAIQSSFSTKGTRVCQTKKVYV